MSTFTFSASSSSARPHVQLLHALRLAGSLPTSTEHAAATQTNIKITMYTYNNIQTTTITLFDFSICQQLGVFGAKSNATGNMLKIYRTILNTARSDYIENTV